MRRNFCLFYDLVDSYGQVRGDGTVDASTIFRLDLAVIRTWLDQITKSNEASGLRPVVRTIIELDPTELTAADRALLKKAA